MVKTTEVIIQTKVLKQPTSASSSKQAPISGMSVSSVASTVSSTELIRFCVNSCTSKILLNISSKLYK